MKKILRIPVAFSVILASLFSLFSCFGSVAEAGVATVVIEKDGGYSAYEVDLEKVDGESAGAIAILKYLEENEGMHLAISGTYIKELGALVPSVEKNEYIAIYTSVESDFGTAPFDGTVEYEGKLLTMTGVGINQMTVLDGTVMLFRLESY